MVSSPKRPAFLCPGKVSFLYRQHLAPTRAERGFLGTFQEAPINLGLQSPKRNGPDPAKKVKLERRSPSRENSSGPGDPTAAASSSRGEAEGGGGRRSRRKGGIGRQASIPPEGRTSRETNRCLPREFYLPEAARLPVEGLSEAFREGPAEAALLCASSPPSTRLKGAARGVPNPAPARPERRGLKGGGGGRRRTIWVSRASVRPALRRPLPRRKGSNPRANFLRPAFAFLFPPPRRIGSWRERFVLRYPFPPPPPFKATLNVASGQAAALRSPAPSGPAFVGASNRRSRQAPSAAWLPQRPPRRRSSL